MIEFVFEKLAVPPNGVRSVPDVMLGVVAELRIIVDGNIIYFEHDFPIVELAVAMLAWTRSPERSDFEFDSMETPEPGWVWIRRSGSGGWRVGSIHQDQIEPKTWTTVSIDRAIADFVRRIVHATKKGGVDLGDWIPELASAVP